MVPETGAVLWDSELNGVGGDLGGIYFRRTPPLTKQQTSTKNTKSPTYKYVHVRTRTYTYVRVRTRKLVEGSACDKSPPGPQPPPSIGNPIGRLQSLGPLQTPFMVSTSWIYRISLKFVRRLSHQTKSRVKLSIDMFISALARFSGGLHKLRPASSSIRMHYRLSRSSGA